MQYRPLGRTGLSVSAIGLGTMTWGRQNTEAEGHEQMDYALDQGVTFWDTAEMYAIPPTADTYGRTEEVIGSWFQARGKRDKVVLATKIIGGADGGFAWIRGGQSKLDRANIFAAAEASLRRLKTDYIDLYQLHWPDRATNRFGARTYVHRPEKDGTPIEETLSALDELVKSGKVRHVGLSNESPWGVMQFLKLSEQKGLPRVASIQNAYNLLNRTFEQGLAEVAMREDVGLLAYSPLGAATLTGKYLDGAVPPGTRRAIDHRKSRYATINADAATREYLEVARRHGLSPTQMAIAFTLHQPFVASSLIGATTMADLKSNIAAIDVTLSEEVLKDLNAVNERYPDPCP
ncbi:NADP(H)-dependent aldo-keto reductase [Azospirillum rugosum]|uniref:Aryl-alcohol dehydrogenase-like predicted oxidoreductase n=1 Tax=Azospirillum rugosum TaxID=416170 RepID=A0ABS4SPB1_9PROT|nr:NADP(H)-dependent aldo-keto reductase [Azospirillum rugosum]MBP2293933.1 aryl-alcohol dehydrogenase-like predicted oxidoreductase [Azospirillum rugosum]MDQ0526880.1 aryl-alcohol dehydrogenase-like predicted oxidoreductase [Azospirillum rugosum]